MLAPILPVFLGIKGGLERLNIKAECEKCGKPLKIYRSHQYKGSLVVNVLMIQDASVHHPRGHHEVFRGVG